MNRRGAVRSVIRGGCRLAPLSGYKGDKISSITFVSHTAEPGGAELALSRYLKQTTLDAGLLTLEPGSLWDELRSEGVAVKLVNERKTSVGTALLRLRRALRSSEAKLIVANSMRSAFYCALVKPRKSVLVYWVRDGLKQSGMSPLSLLATARITLPRVESCIANSEWTASTIAAVSPRTPVRIAPSPSGLREEILLAPRSGPHSRKITSLLYLGRISRWKGLHHVIRAMSSLIDDEERDYKLTVAGGALFGDQDYEREIRLLTESLGLGHYVTFLGHVSDVNALLAEHDVLIHASIVPEPFGQVVVQGMGAGLPVIATNAGGPREIITHGHNGLLYEPGNEEQLASCVIALSKDDLYSSISSNAVVRALDYTDTRVVKEIDRALMAVISAKTFSNTHLGETQ